MPSLNRTAAALVGAAALAVGGPAPAQTPGPARMAGVGPWTTAPVFTTGESSGSCVPPGIPAGMGAFDRGEQGPVRVNHEPGAGSGYPYAPPGAD